MRTLGILVTMLGVAVLLAAVVLGVRSLPDIQRYLRIRGCERRRIMSDQPGSHLEEEPQSERGAPGSRDTGSDEPAGGPVDRPSGDARTPTTPRRSG
jgi:hypothetical protein